MKATLFEKCSNEIGEAATWLSYRSQLLWVDIAGGVLHLNSPDTGNTEKMRFSSQLSSIIPIDADRLALTLKERLVCYDLKSKQKQTLLNFSFGNDFRPNDAKASPDGRLWVGVMHTSRHDKTGFLYRIDPDLSMHKILENQSIPNGMVWNSTGELMYYVDSGRGCIEEYHYKSSDGSIKYSRTVVKVPPEMGVPDGMTIDAEGNLWIAHWGGFGVYVWSVGKGSLLDKVEVPVPHVSSCTFCSSGKLYITTAHSGLSATQMSEHPLSGSLFVCETSAKPGENHYKFRTL